MPRRAVFVLGAALLAALACAAAPAPAADPAITTEEAVVPFAWIDPAAAAAWHRVDPALAPLDAAGRRASVVQSGGWFTLSSGANRSGNDEQQEQ